MFPHLWRPSVNRQARPARGRRPHAFRPRVEAFEDRLLLTVFLVTTTDDSGDGSLRQAILDSNADTIGTNTIDFNIQTGFREVKTIQPTSPLPDITQPVVIDGTTQPGLPGYPHVAVDGSQAGNTSGLTIRAGNSTVRGLIVDGFQQQGISLVGPAGGNLIAGNYIGADNFGTPVPNGGDGVGIVGSNNNTVGGLTAAARNVISGNTGAGVSLSANAAGNVVVGNYIGVDVTSYSVLANHGPGVSLTGGAIFNVIGGAVAGAGNVISGNGGDGVVLSGGVGTHDNAVQGNMIGTDVRGIARVPNTGSGVVIRGGASFNIIGGAVTAARNVVSANGHEGILITDAGTTGNQVQGNVVGTNANGTAPLANGGNYSGINLTSGASGNTIGGAAAGAGNVVSGNSLAGITLSGNTTVNNVLQGNRIGTDISGTASLSNSNAGIDLSNGANHNTIGGPGTGAGNLISGNNGSGISLSGIGVAGNIIQGNLIGTDASGTAVLGNRFNGVTITNGASDNTIGGTAQGVGNVISGNAVDGVAISANGTVTRGNVIQGNNIGTDGSGTVALSNYDGVLIRDPQATANTVGGTDAGAGNLVSGNLRDGIQLFQTPGNLVQGNLIGTDGSGSNPLGNSRNGVLVTGSPATHNTVGGAAPGAANTIGFNGYDGVFLGGDLNATNVASQNSISSDTRLGIESPNANYPNLASATSDGSSVTIDGTVAGSPGDMLTLEFFTNTTPSPTGFGEGQTYLGTLMMTMDASGTTQFTATFQVAVSPGTFISATSTGLSVDTSGFSPCVEVAAAGASRGKRDLLTVAARAADGAALGFVTALSEQPPNVAEGDGLRPAATAFDLSVGGPVDTAVVDRVFARATALARADDFTTMGDLDLVLL